MNRNEYSRRPLLTRTSVLFLMVLLITLTAACGKSTSSEPASIPAPAPQEPADTAGSDAGADVEKPDAGKSEPDAGSPDEPGDFDVSGPKFNWINWDADGDGKEEELCFEYIDQGDEAPSMIEVTLYGDKEEQKAYIDRAYGLRRIFAREDEDGPFLDVAFDLGDYYGHGAEGHCTIRLRDGEFVVETEE